MKPHRQKTFSLDAAAEALASAEGGHLVGKVVLTVG
ncbi:NADPH:quinone reductase-like Zn-dependent oxidoreductase [Bradyrhizobium algeriense]|uniref:NADPH:quinone reductase-like Zn-dependent oxidoreductase n=1 Tax=Bradyrhizobium algeriense TaxID=634784 RepID=A0ABU8B5P2_9BRAD